MDENDFEGTLVLEKLAENNLVDAFFEAIDSDNMGLVKSLLKKAHVDMETTNIVLQKIREAHE